jgi:uncharacterized protein YceK
MAFRISCVALLLSSLAVAGCGTVANVVGTRPEDGGKTPFGGVRQDVSCMKRAANGEFALRAHPRSDAEPYPQVALMLLCAADLPASLMADLVMWPYTMAYTFINQPVPTPPMTSAPPPPAAAVPTPPGTQPMPLPMPLPVPPWLQPAPLPAQPAPK